MSFRMEPNMLSLEKAETFKKAKGLKMGTLRLHLDITRHDLEQVSQSVPPSVPILVCDSCYRGQGCTKALCGLRNASMLRIKWTADTWRYSCLQAQHLGHDLA